MKPVQKYSSVLAISRLNKEKMRVWIAVCAAGNYRPSSGYDDWRRWRLLTWPTKLFRSATRNINLFRVHGEFINLNVYYIFKFIFYHLNLISKTHKRIWIYNMYPNTFALFIRTRGATRQQSCARNFCSVYVILGIGCKMFATIFR